jgi:hypothetical protein
MTNKQPASARQRYLKISTGNPLFYYRRFDLTEQCLQGQNARTTNLAPIVWTHTIETDGRLRINSRK